jgi:hypothetical protein
VAGKAYGARHASEGGEVPLLHSEYKRVFVLSIQLVGARVNERKCPKLRFEINGCLAKKTVRHQWMWLIALHGHGGVGGHSRSWFVFLNYL